MTSLTRDVEVGQPSGLKLFSELRQRIRSEDLGLTTDVPFVGRRSVGGRRSLCLGRHGGSEFADRLSVGDATEFLVQAHGRARQDTRQGVNVLAHAAHLSVPESEQSGTRMITAELCGAIRIQIDAGSSEDIHQPVIHGADPVGVAKLGNAVGTGAGPIAFAHQKGVGRSVGEPAERDVAVAMKGPKVRL